MNLSEWSRQALDGVQYALIELGADIAQGEWEFLVAVTHEIKERESRSAADKLYEMSVQDWQGLPDDTVDAIFELAIDAVPEALHGNDKRAVLFYLHHEDWRALPLVNVVAILAMVENAEGIPQ